MNIYLNNVRGMDDAIISMYMSKPGSWNPELQQKIITTVRNCTDANGKLLTCAEPGDKAQYCDWMDRLLKWGRMHITMLKFIDLSITVEGLHRAGQDDLDAHAKRFDNRIIRNSTRAASSDDNLGRAVSEYYQEKVIPTDKALDMLDIKLPDILTDPNGKEFVRAANGYIAKGLETNPDVRRGLYHLGLPSNCIFKVNLSEFAHVYKLRNRTTHAHPELQEAVEQILQQLTTFYPGFTRELLMEIDN